MIVYVLQRKVVLDQENEFPNGKNYGESDRHPTKAGPCLCKKEGQEWRAKKESLQLLEAIFKKGTEKPPFLPMKKLFL